MIEFSKYSNQALSEQIGLFLGMAETNNELLGDFARYAAEQIKAELLQRPDGPTPNQLAAIEQGIREMFAELNHTPVKESAHSFINSVVEEYHGQMTGNPAPTSMNTRLSEAIMGFLSYMTTRKEIVCLGATKNPSRVIELVTLFCFVNKLPTPRENRNTLFKSPTIKDEKENLY